MQYFAQDEAARLDPDLDRLRDAAAGSPIHMVPAIRNILGGFLFSGDDVYKKAGVLSGGERTRLAVARMLLRPSNTLLLDEPTNHLDLDSKDVLLDALEDYGGTLIFVSHDRYFVEKLANRIIEVGGGDGAQLPGQVRGVPVEQGASADARGGRAGGRAGQAGRQGQRAHGRPRVTRAGEAAAASRRPRRAAAEAAGRGRRPAPAERRTRQATTATPGARRRPRRAVATARQRRTRRGSPTLESRIADVRGRDQGTRGGDGQPGVLRRSRPRRSPSSTATRR